MTLKEALIKYSDIDELYIFMCNENKKTWTERNVFSEDHIDKLPKLKRLLLLLKSNCKTDIQIISNLDGSEIKKVILRVNYTGHSKFRERFKKIRATKGNLEVQK